MLPYCDGKLPTVLTAYYSIHISKYFTEKAMLKKKNSGLLHQLSVKPQILQKFWLHLRVCILTQGQVFTEKEARMVFFNQKLYPNFFHQSISSHGASLAPFHSVSTGENPCYVKTMFAVQVLIYHRFKILVSIIKNISKHQLLCKTALMQ